MSKKISNMEKFVECLTCTKERTNCGCVDDNRDTNCEGYERNDEIVERIKRMSSDKGVFD